MTRLLPIKLLLEQQLDFVSTAAHADAVCCEISATLLRASYYVSVSAPVLPPLLPGPALPP
jgi:hypothetical protein